VKTTYMVADMLSRQTNMVYGHDIQGMADVANGDHPRLRRDRDARHADRHGQR
jgi:hypothetical protein